MLNMACKPISKGPRLFRKPYREKRRRQEKHGHHSDCSHRTAVFPCCRSKLLHDLTVVSCSFTQSRHDLAIALCNHIVCLKLVSIKFCREKCICLTSAISLCNRSLFDWARKLRFWSMRNCKSSCLLTDSNDSCTSLSFADALFVSLVVCCWMLPNVSIATLRVSEEWLACLAAS